MSPAVIPAPAADHHMNRKARVLNGIYSDCDSAAILRKRLRQEGYSIFEWSDGPNAYYSPHSHPHDEFIVVVSGEIVFTIDGAAHVVASGDALDLPAGTLHSAENAGNQPVVYFICTK